MTILNKSLYSSSFIYIFIFALLCFGFSSSAIAQMLVEDIDHDNSKPIEVTSDTLKVFPDEQMATFRGKVEAIQGDVNLKSDVMHVHYKKQSTGSNDNKISKIISEGNVHLTAPRKSATSNKGVYDVDSGIITMTGNVTLKDKENVLNGERFTYNVNTGISQMQNAAGSEGGDKRIGEKKEGGRVKGVFVPSKKPEKEKQPIEKNSE